MREHLIEEARIHYADTNTVGVSPNVVQANAEVHYLVRAPKISDVDRIYQRICKIAERAALMAETEVSIHFDNACSNYIPDRHLEKILHDKFVETGVEKMWNTLSNEEKNNFIKIAKGIGYHGYGKEFKGKYLADTISPYVPSQKILKGPTDIGDVSCVVPTAQLSSDTAVLDASLHFWQMTTQGLTSIANKGMLRAAQAMALTGLHILQNPADLQKVKEEFKKENPYTCLIPQDVKPSKLNKN